MATLKGIALYALIYSVGLAAALGSAWLGIFAISVPLSDAWYDDLARSLFWFGPTILRFIAGLAALVLGLVAFETFRTEPTGDSHA